MSTAREAMEHVLAQRELHTAFCRSTGRDDCACQVADLRAEKCELKADLEQAGRVCGELANELEAAKDDQQLLQELLFVLGREVGKTGESEGAVDVAERLIRERDEARAEIKRLERERDEIFKALPATTNGDIDMPGDVRHLVASLAIARAESERLQKLVVELGRAPF